MKDIGEMDRRISIYQRVITYDTNGGEINTWSLYGSRWAKREDRGGGEPIQDDALLKVHDVVFTIRYESGITKDMVVYYSSQAYDIEHIAEIGRNDKMQLFCKYKSVNMIT